MTTATSVWTEEIIEVADTRLQLAKGGDGDPLLVLHDEMGHHGALRWHDALAEGNTLHIPSHPGFGESPRMDWVMNMRDLAGWYLRALDELGLAGRKCHRLLARRLAGGGDGDDVSAAVQQDDSRGRGGHKAGHR